MNPPRPTERLLRTSSITSAETSATRAGLPYVFDHKRENVPRGGSRHALRRVPPNPEPGVPSPQDRLCSVPDLKLGEDRRQVVGDGLR
jgi:hypothetical protein